MPLRDHFRPPVSQRVTWEEIHGMWPGSIVRQLRQLLPPGYVAGPRVHLGAQVEIDVAAYERDDASPQFEEASARGGVAVETELPDFDEYEVRVYDAIRGRTLVAAIELVSPGNKDRPEKRNAFVGKCAGLLQKGVAVSVVDLVTIRQANLDAELMAFIGHRDPTMCDDPPSLYAASCRWVPRGNKNILEAWSHRMTIGQSLPTLPLWLAESLVVPLDLETSYEQACHDLWIT